MEHPQPAFGLLRTLSSEDSDSESIFGDWWSHSESAKKGDRIESHPEIWQTMELPDALNEMTKDHFVGVEHGETLNLNAAAIGLGLENVVYDPQSFAGLVYDIDPFDATVILFQDGLRMGISEDENAVIESLQETEHQLDQLGLNGGNTHTTGDLEAKRVGTLLEPEPWS